MDKNGKTGRRYSAEEKAAAVGMVRTLRAELGADRGTAQRVALQLGFGVESVRSGRGSDRQTSATVSEVVLPRMVLRRFNGLNRNCVK